MSRETRNIILAERIFVSHKNGTKHSRMNQIKLFKGCLSQILLGPFDKKRLHLGSFHMTFAKSLEQIFSGTPLDYYVSNYL